MSNNTDQNYALFQSKNKARDLVTGKVLSIQSPKENDDQIDEKSDFSKDSVNQYLNMSLVEVPEEQKSNIPSCYYSNDNYS